MEGKFVVKTKEGSFNADSPDMKLEQTTQSPKKNPGVIGQTQQYSYVTEWELVYHEILPITNCYHNFTSLGLSFRETDLHHELGGTISTLLNNSVKKIVSLERDNPFLIAKVTKLHHFTTGQCITETQK